MTKHDTLPPVLMADDDPDDCVLTGEAFKAADLKNPLRFVADGEKLLSYLRECQKNANLNCWPALILLDLNMPRIDGREALSVIKSLPEFKNIPVVIWTTSRAVDDAFSARAVGCDDYFSKPASFSEMVGLVRLLNDRWLAAPDAPANDP